MDGLNRTTSFQLRRLAAVILTRLARDAGTHYRLETAGGFGFGLSLLLPGSGGLIFIQNLINLGWKIVCVLGAISPR